MRQSHVPITPPPPSWTYMRIERVGRLRRAAEAAGILASALAEVCVRWWLHVRRGAA